MFLPITRALKLCRRDLRQAFVYALRWFQAWRYVVACALAFLVILIWQARVFDEPAALAAAQLRSTSPSVVELARRFSYFGDFLGFNVCVFVALQVVGWSLRSRRLVRLAVASLLCACFSGLAANVVRSVVGRPRPSAHLADGFYGPSLKGDMHSLPSAHTATAFGAAMPVLLSEPLIGAPMVAFAGCVGWSRIELERHHLTDVLLSVGLATLFSLPLSQWALRGLVRQPRWQRSRLNIPVSHPLAATRQPR